MMADKELLKGETECPLYGKAKDEEIAKLRALVEGLLAASAMECADCTYDCGPNRENCIIHEASNYIKKVEVEND